MHLSKGAGQPETGQWKQFYAHVDSDRTETEGLLSSTRGSSALPGAAGVERGIAFVIQSSRGAEGALGSTGSAAASESEALLAPAPRTQPHVTIEL